MKIVRYCHVDGQRMVSLLWTFSVRGPPVWFSIVLLGGNLSTEGWSHTLQVSSVASCDRMPRTLGIPRFFSHPGYPFYRKLEVLYIFWGGCWGRWISWHVSHMFFFSKMELYRWHDMTFSFSVSSMVPWIFCPKCVFFVRKPIPILFPFPKKTPILESCSKNFWLVPWHSGKVINFAVLVWIPKTDTHSSKLA